MGVRISPATWSDRIRVARAACFVIPAQAGIQGYKREVFAVEYEEILDILAPCGLNCGKCLKSTKGDIPFHSQKLQELLGNFDIYAERFSAFLPEFKDYPSFKKMLACFATPDCMGCRQGTRKPPNCGVTDCYKEKA